MGLTVQDLIYELSKYPPTSRIVCLIGCNCCEHWGMEGDMTPDIYKWDKDRVMVEIMAGEIGRHKLEELCRTSQE